MQPCQIARATWFGPDELKVIFKAFDDAWSEIAPKIGTEPDVVEVARTSLATIVLGIATDKQPATPKALTALAVAVFCDKYRLRLATRAGSPKR